MNYYGKSKFIITFIRTALCCIILNVIPYITLKIYLQLNQMLLKEMQLNIQFKSMSAQHSVQLILCLDLWYAVMYLWVNANLHVVQLIICKESRVQRNDTHKIYLLYCIIRILLYGRCLMPNKISNYIKF